MEYKALEGILADLHRIAPEDLKAFRSRLRVLRDVGVPRVQKPGKGARISYERRDVEISHLGLIMLNGGLPPSAVKLVAEKMLHPMQRAVWHHVYVVNGDDMWVIFLVDLRARTEAEQVRVWNAPASLFQHSILTIQPFKPNPEGRGAQMHSLINLSQLERDCRQAITDYGARAQ